jgi:hypothetical protein
MEEHDTDTEKFDDSEKCEFGLFRYLSICKNGLHGMYLNMNLNPPVQKNSLRSFEYYNYLSFRIYICELIYRGIKEFPRICEYTITCTNDSGTKSMVFKNYDELADDGTACMGKLYTEDNQVYHFTVKDIKDLFMSNRYNLENTNIDTFILLLHLSGWDPIVKTEYKINPKYVKYATKH